MTTLERAVWDSLRRGKLGVKFRRQVPFGPYILDFFCVEAMLAVELDGPEHFIPERVSYDMRRDQYLGRRNVKVMRFENSRVQLHWGEVEKEIREALRDRGVSHLPPE